MSKASERKSKFFLKEKFEKTDTNELDSFSTLTRGVELGCVKFDLLGFERKVNQLTRSFDRYSDKRSAPKSEILFIEKSSFVKFYVNEDFPRNFISEHINVWLNRLPYYILIASEKIFEPFDHRCHFS